MSLDEDLGNFLSRYDLPTENIIVKPSDRIPIFQNAPSILEQLPEGIRENAFYLSKFYLSAAVGLFDAALNYLWDLFPNP